MNLDSDQLPAFQETTTFTAGEWLVQPDHGRLSRAGRVEHVEPRVMHVLCCLSSRSGQVISRESLLRAVWLDTVVNEESLTKSISVLRRVFADDPKNPRVIETVIKRGYRFLLPVQQVAEANGAAETPEVVTPETLPGRSPRRRILIAGAVLLPLVAIALLFVFAALPTPSPRKTVRSTPVTRYPGRERHPCFSPDGNLVAFSWNSCDSTGWDIFIRQIDSDNPLRLTRHPEDEIFPVWSPDGKTLAFLRRGDEGGLFTIPALGGNAQRLLEFPVDPTGLDWSPDGKQLVFAREPAADSTAALYSYALATGKVRRLSTPPPDHRGDRYPAISPDGQSIAFVRSDGAGFHDLHLLSLADDKIRRITRNQRRVVSVDWFPDGERLIFCARPKGMYQLFTVDVHGGDPVWFPTQHETAMRPAVSPDGDCLIYEALQVDIDIMQIWLASDLGSAPDLIPLVQSTAIDRDARFSHDGTRLVFVSSRSGYLEIWVCDAGGAIPRQITDYEGADLRSPVWSPDDRFLAYSVANPDQYELVIHDLESGQPRQILRSEAHEIVDFWSSDGRWLYYHVSVPTGHHYYRISIDDQEVEHLGLDQVGLLKQSASGDLWYLKWNNGDLWMRPLETGIDSLVRPEFFYDRWQDLEPAAGGLFFTAGTPEHPLLVYLDAAGEKQWLFPEIDADYTTNIVVSPAGDRVLLERQRIECDLMLVESPD
ncbi:MAG: winged helix-turn-helix domain-containing protein [bacterium]